MYYTMYPKYYFHIQLTSDSEWTKEIGHSLNEVMANLATYDTMPYAYIKGERFQKGRDIRRIPEHVDKLLIVNAP